MPATYLCKECGKQFVRYNTIQKLCGVCSYSKAKKSPSKPRKPIQQRGREARKWDTFRDKVARPYLDKNYGIACVDCGVLPPTKDDGTHYRHDVDHVKGKGSHPELKYDLRNLRYRCRKCHIRKTGVPQWSKLQE